MPLEGTPVSSSTVSQLPEDLFLSYFRTSLLQARRFASQGISSVYIPFDHLELPENAFEYKPELTASQVQQDITRKFRFDKLDQPVVKRRRLSSEDNSFHLKDGPVSEHKEIVSMHVDEEVKYGQAWLQRYIFLLQD